MNSHKGLLGCGMLLIVLCATPCLAYRAKLHRAINASAITQKLLTPRLAAYFNDNFGYANADALVNAYSIADWFRNGGTQEDQPGLRMKNHVHDPVANSGFSGSLFGMTASGDPAVVWAQKSLAGQSPGGAYSWQDARHYFYTALTSDSSTLREQNLADSFRAVGQVMHLLAEMSLPDNTRDTGRIDSKTIEPWLEKVVTDSEPLNTQYSAQLTTALNSPIAPDPSLLQQAGLFPATLIPIANLFDFEKYSGSNPAVTTSAPIGLAEYSNANLFSINTIFRNYNYPALSDVSEFSETDPVTGKIRSYISSPEVPYLAQTNAFHRYLAAGKANGYTLENNKVHANYMEKMIPRAVGYAGALIDYFYRGSIELSLPAKGIYAITAPDGSFSEIRVKARNTTSTGEEMTNGTFQLVVRYTLALEDPFQSSPVTVGPRQYHIIPEKNGVSGISKTTPSELVFDLSSAPIPLWATDIVIQLVFKGQLGNEIGAVALGSRDISEPTPLDVANNMDYACVNGTYLTAGSSETIAAVDSDHNGSADWDVFPHGLGDVYAAFNGSPASVNNYSAKFASIPPGSYGRVYLLADSMAESLATSLKTTVQKLDLRDTWTWNFSVFTGTFNPLIHNQEFYPLISTRRGVDRWIAVNYAYPGYPSGTSCSWTGSEAPLSGPVTVNLQ